MYVTAEREIIMGYPVSYFCCLDDTIEYIYIFIFSQTFLEDLFIISIAIFFLSKSDVPLFSILFTINPRSAIFSWEYSQDWIIQKLVILRYIYRKVPTLFLPFLLHNLFNETQYIQCIYALTNPSYTFYMSIDPCKYRVL